MLLFSFVDWVQSMLLCIVMLRKSCWRDVTAIGSVFWGSWWLWNSPLIWLKLLQAMYYFFGKLVIRLSMFTLFGWLLFLGLIIYGRNVTYQIDGWNVFRHYFCCCQSDRAKNDTSRPLFGFFVYLPYCILNSLVKIWTLQLDGARDSSASHIAVGTRLSFFVWLRNCM